MRRIANIYVATCSTQDLRNEERLQIILLKNEYPENIINQSLKKKQNGSSYCLSSIKKQKI